MARRSRGGHRPTAGARAPQPRPEGGHGTIPSATWQPRFAWPGTGARGPWLCVPTSPWVCSYRESAECADSHENIAYARRAGKSAYEFWAGRMAKMACKPTTSCCLQTGREEMREGAASCHNFNGPRYLLGGTNEASCPRRHCDKGRVLGQCVFGKLRLVSNELSPSALAVSRCEPRGTRAASLWRIRVAEVVRLQKS